MFTLAIYLVFSAALELFGLRAPTSDLAVTFSLGLITFFLLNFFGLKKLGIGGRLASMGGSVKAMRPIMIPIKIVSDIAIPVSLACRLFGNMLGGMIVMELLKGALGGYASGIPGVAGLYFNLFHPVIQAYIFITLSLTFIDEAMESPEKE
jgi:F-type H+-transporting ATPase subunit a